jgi:hypothetical protein
VKRRDRPVRGSITEALESFQAEVRFYREIAPVNGIRVSACYEAQVTDEGTALVLEDLGGWQLGADPMTAAQILSGMHRGWVGQALVRWPWLRPVGLAVEFVEELFARVWPDLEARAELTAAVRVLGERLVGNVARAERAINTAGPLTLVHGDASLLNMRTGPGGQVVLLTGRMCQQRGESLIWAGCWSRPLTLCSGMRSLPVTARPPVWHVCCPRRRKAFSLSDTPAGSAAAVGWIQRLEATARRLRWAS